MSALFVMFVIALFICIVFMSMFASIKYRNLPEGHKWKVIMSYERYYCVECSQMILWEDEYGLYLCTFKKEHWCDARGSAVRSCNEAKMDEALS